MPRGAGVLISFLYITSGKKDLLANVTTLWVSHVIIKHSLDVEESRLVVILEKERLNFVFFINQYVVTTKATKQHLR